VRRRPRLRLAVRRVDPGLITTLVNFQGSLTNWWATIFVGVLLFVFIVAQRTIMSSFIGRRTV
jgi:hypothetical protein